MFVGRPEGKSLLGRSRYRHGTNIKKDIKEKSAKFWTSCMWLRIGSISWFFVNAKMNIPVP
jgi:hypothetical protein